MLASIMESNSVALMVFGVSLTVFSLAEWKPKRRWLAVKIITARTVFELEF